MKNPPRFNKHADKHDNCGPYKGSSATMEMMKELSESGCSRKPGVTPNSREVILDRVGRLFLALHLEVLRDGWNRQNHRLHNHISSVCWQLPDGDEAEALTDLLTGMLTYEL